jgi:tRNA (adenine22-N1)-methyltransferase
MSNRLKGLVSEIDIPCSVADIGTDHAYIPIYLAQNFECEKVIATDAKLGPYQVAKENIKSFDLEDKIEVRLGQGLDVLKPHEIKTVVIAGMGGNTILEILEGNEGVRDSIVRFILQPMNASASLRKWLINNHFQIIDEKLIKDNDKFYEIIIIEAGQEVILDEFLLEIGPRLIEKESKYYRDFLHNKRRRWQQILSSLPEIDNLEVINKKKNLKNKLIRIQEVIRCL